ncbi:33254_t:CDS:1, partial [Racocetra persica]
SSQAKKRKRQETNDFIAEKENIMNFTDIKDFIYYALLEHKNLDDNLEGQASFQLQFDIDLDSIYENTSTEDIIKEKNSYIADLVINEISCGDGYTYVFNKKYNSKNSDFTTLTYWCNARKGLSKPQRKVEDISKQRNSEPYIERYECKGLVTVKIYSQNKVTVNVSHNILHPRLEKISVTKEIKSYINSCIGQSVPNIYQSIKDQRINGYEFLTIKQVYYWWSSIVQVEYRYCDDELASARTFLQKQNQKILFFEDY